MSTPRLVISFVVAGLALSLAWSLLRVDRVPEPTPAGAGAQPGTNIVAQPATNVAAPTSGPAPSVSALAASVAAEVARLNAEARKDHDAFTQAGWKMVQVAPPDPRLLALDPALLSGGEAELAVQLATTTPPSDRAPNVLAIAERAKLASTRVAAVEALGRMGGEGRAALQTLVADKRLDARDPAFGLALASISSNTNDSQGDLP